MREFGDELTFTLEHRRDLRAQVVEGARQFDEFTRAVWNDPRVESTVSEQPRSASQIAGRPNDRLGEPISNNDCDSDEGCADCKQRKPCRGLSLTASRVGNKHSNCRVLPWARTHGRHKLQPAVRWTNIRPTRSKRFSNIGGPVDLWPDRPPLGRDYGDVTSTSGGGRPNGCLDLFGRSGDDEGRNNRCGFSTCYIDRSIFCRPSNNDAERHDKSGYDKQRNRDEDED